MNLLLSVDPQIVNNIVDTICYNGTYTVGSSTYTSTGVYADTLSAANGCDSIINLNLTELPENDTLLNYNLCYGDSITVAGNTYSITGTYRIDLVGAKWL